MQNCGSFYKFLLNSAGKQDSSKDLKLHGLDHSSSSEQWAASTVRQGRSEAAWGCKPEAGSPANDDDDDDEAVAASTKWGKSFNQASH